MPQQGQAQLTVFTKDLGPWTPDIDARRAEKAQIITGTNFIDDIDGPRSAWSSNFINLNFWDSATKGKINELPLKTGSPLYGTQTGVYRVDDVSGLIVPVLLIAPSNQFWPWTIAFVGGLYYLAQYDIGLWQYDPVNNTIGHVDTPSGDTVRFVVAAFGRLVAFSDSVLFWSDLDDGTSLNPSIETGAGAQDLSIIGGVPYRMEVLSDGVLTYTSAGVMKSLYVQQAYVFQHAPLTGDIQVFSPNATLFIPRVGALSLDGNGLNLTKWFNYTDLGIPQPWEIEKSDYIKKNILNVLDENDLGTIGMYFSVSMQMAFIYFSGNTNQGLFVNTFVWSTITKKWSSFDQQHYGIFSAYDANSDSFFTSYMGIDGYMHAFSNANFTQDLPQAPNVMSDYVFRVEFEEPVVGEINDADVQFQLGVTEIMGSDNNPFWYNNITSNYGTFMINDQPYSDTANDASDDPPFIDGNPIIGGTYINMDTSGGIEYFAVPFQLPTIGLNSSLQVGPFRFEDQQFADETSSIDTVNVGLTQSSTFNLFEDWNVMNGPDDDWNNDNGNQDWGSGISTPNMFDLQLISSADGFNPGQQGIEDLPIYEDNGSSQMFKPQGWSGIYHSLTFNADAPGQAFAVKVLDITGTLTGRNMAA